MTATGGNRTNPNATSRRDYLKAMTSERLPRGLDIPGLYSGLRRNGKWPRRLGTTAIADDDGLVIAIECFF